MIFDGTKVITCQVWFCTVWILHHLSKKQFSNFFSLKWRLCRISRKTELDLSRCFLVFTQPNIFHKNFLTWDCASVRYDTGTLDGPGLYTAILTRCLSIFEASNGTWNSWSWQEVQCFYCLLPGCERSWPEYQEQERPDTTRPLPRPQSV